MKFFNSFSYMGWNVPYLSTQTLVLVRKGSSCNRKYVFSLKLIFFAYLQGAITTTKNFRNENSHLSLSRSLSLFFLSFYLYSLPVTGTRESFLLCARKLSSLLFSPTLSCFLCCCLLHFAFSLLLSSSHCPIPLTAIFPLSSLIPLSILTHQRS